MVHVRFNEKVECHQYDTAAPQTEAGTKLAQKIDATTTIRPELVDPAIVKAGAPVFKYNSDFLKTLRHSPLTQTCPDELQNMKGIVRSIRKDNVSKPSNSMTSTRQIGKRNVFDKKLQLPSESYVRPNHLRLNSLYDSENRFDYNHPTYNAPRQPIGFQGRFTGVQTHFKTSHQVPTQPTPEPTQKNHYANVSVKSDHDVEPEWYREGPTSKFDCVDLHGFVGGDEASCENKKGYFESEEGNISYGANSPPAKSTPAKGTANDVNNDSRRSTKFERSNHWPTNSANRQNSVPPAFYEFMKNAQPIAPNFNFGGKPVRKVQDIEAVAYDHLKFRQMIAQLKVPQNVYGPRNTFFEMLQQSNADYCQLPVPNTTQILMEISKILNVSKDPVFKRTEVRTLIRNIVESVIPPENISTLLKNPLTEPHSRETIVAIINLIDMARTNATKELRHTHPSHAQLQAHTDAIMQNAIIKKKIERLHLELLKQPLSAGASINQPFRPGGVPNQRNFAWQQRNSPGPNSPQHMVNGQGQRGEARFNTVGDINLKQWLSPELLNKAASGELPSIHSIREALILEEYERSMKEGLLKDKPN